MARPTSHKSNKIQAKPRGGRIKKSSAGPMTRSAQRVKGARDANKNNPLLCLPGELRNMIYEHALGTSNVWPVTTLSGVQVLQASQYGKCDNNEASVKNWESLFNLSLVSRQVNHETRLLPYKFNVFRGDTHLDLGDFLSRLSQEKRSAITIVSLGSALFSCEEHEHRIEPILKKLDKCTGLKTIMYVSSHTHRREELVKDYAQKRSLECVEETLDQNFWKHVNAYFETCGDYNCPDCDSD